MKKEIEVNGTWFYEKTNPLVIQAILNNIHKNRVRLWYGKNGKSWNEENDICGYIGRTTGKHFPILVNNSRSYGGGIILTDCIVKMIDTKTGRTLYKHPNFKQSEFIAKNECDIPEYKATVFCDGAIYSRHKTFKQAERLADFMNGKRNNK